MVAREPRLIGMRSIAKGGHIVLDDRQNHMAHLLVVLTAQRWESVRPIIGRTLARRRTRVSDLRRQGPNARRHRIPTRMRGR